VIDSYNQISSLDIVCARVETVDTARTALSLRIAIQLDEKARRCSRATPLYQGETDQLARRLRTDKPRRADKAARNG
jgi:hypothetical protein